MEAVITHGPGLNLARQSFLGPKSNDVLHKTRVAIIGLGGGGSHIAQQLAHVGVGDLLLLDPDRIEGTNLNRLVGGTAADVKRKLHKVRIAKRIVKAVNATATIVARPFHWQHLTSLLQDRDLIFGCIDSLSGRSELEAFARRCAIPLIDIGMDVSQFDAGFLVGGQVAISMPGMPCLRCMGILNEEAMTREAEQYGQAGARPQVVWANGILASTAVGIFMTLTTSWQTPPSVSLLMEYDGNSQTMTPSTKLPYFPKACAHYAEIGNLGDPLWSASSSDNHQPRKACPLKRFAED
jgi:molybdopterin/thiamine biosynthesis adenylyltransferase